MLSVFIKRHFDAAAANFVHCKNSVIFINMQSSSYSRFYTEAITSGGWAPKGRRSGGEPLAIVVDLTGSGIKPKTSCADSDVFNHNGN